MCVHVGVIVLGIGDQIASEILDRYVISYFPVM